MIALMPRREQNTLPIRLPHAVSAFREPDHPGDRHDMAYCRFQHKICDRKSSRRVEPVLVLRVGLSALIVLTVGALVSAAADEANPKNAAGKPFSPEAVDFFEARVRPILVDQCIKCHGPKKQSSGLRLDSREAAIKGGDSGPALVPAKPDESLLIRAIAQTHEELKMPPKGKLPEASVAILRQWVAQGPRGRRRRQRQSRQAEPRATSRRRHTGRSGPFASPRVPAVKNRRLGENTGRCVHPGPARGGRDHPVGPG